MVITWLKRILIITAIALIAGLTFLALKPRAVLVDIARIDKGLVEVSVKEDGVTRIEDVFEISAPITGKLERPGFEVGDLVEKGQKIALFRPVDPPMRDVRTQRELDAALKAARAGVALGRAEVARAEAAVKFSSLELERQKKLAKQQIISVRVLQQAELELDTQNAQLSQARANLEFRQRELETAEVRRLEPAAAMKSQSDSSCCIELRAPAAGAILKLYAESEKVVMAGTKLLEIGDRTKIEVVADLLSEDAVKVGVGNVVWIEDWGGEQRLRARVKRIDPSGFLKVSALGIEEQRVNAIIEITEPRKNWLRLGHDFRVYVQIVIWRDEKAIRVPLEALFRRGDSWAVFVVQGGRAIERKISILKRNDRYGVVSEGLAETEQVILHPSDRIFDRTRVEIRQ